jgi:hypothetical protein
MRWPREQQFLPRMVLSIVALCALVSTVIAGLHVVQPVVVTERDNFITDFLAFRWIYFPAQGCNLPCVLGILAAACILVTTLRPAWTAAAIWVFAAFSIPLALAAFPLDWLTAPYAQWAARHNGALMSLPLAALLLVALVHTPLANAVARGPACGIVVLVGLAVSLWHVAGTEKWSAFLMHFSDVLQSHSGVIPWDVVAAPSGSRQEELAWKMVWAWTNPDLSLVALPRSCVNSVIDNPPGLGWQPYTLSNIATMPALRNVTYTYLLPPDRQRAACPTAGGSQVNGRR